MRHLPAPLTPPMIVIRLPFSISLRAMQLHCDLLQSLLVGQGHNVVLDRIDPDPVRGWLIHLKFKEVATIDLQHDVAERKYRQDDPPAEAHSTESPP